MAEVLSVIVVTYNRASLIKECLESVLSQDFDAEFEVVVIDNCSSDATAQVLKDISERRMKFVVNKARMGLPACKNLGLRLSRGSMIAFIDDDCLAAENWLKNIADSLKHYDFVGGVVLPLPGTKFPWWWNDSLNWMVGINPAPNKKFLALGSNLAFKRAVLDKLEEDNRYLSAGFNQYLPYREDNYRIQKALAAGFTMGINKEMAVYHSVPKTRLRINYLLKRSYFEGYAWAIYEKGLKNLGLSFLGLIINFLRLLISGNINYLFRCLVNFSYISNYSRKGCDAKNS